MNPNISFRSELLRSPIAGNIVWVVVVLLLLFEVVKGQCAVGIRVAKSVSSYTLFDRITSGSVEMFGARGGQDKPPVGEIGGKSDEISFQDLTQDTQSYLPRHVVTS